ncbi:MAG: hypothetical protein QOJ35_3505 [Solirubrobacteraceae bacterium]|nr:hypothetical protein [Solirubrobacteraceae bacterium]
MAATLDELRAEVAALAAKRADAVGAAATLGRDADAQAARARAAAAVGDAAAHAEASATVRQARADRRGALGSLAELDSAFVAAVAELGRLGLDPCDAEVDVPLVLLPVRLETRYSADGETLRVRIYPDDVHVDRLDRGLSDDERAAGLAYWEALWSSDAEGERAAWEALLAAVQPGRAAWVAAALTPVNLANRPVAQQPGGDPAPLPPPDPPLPARRPAIARGLPDRFVVVAILDADNTVSATGSPVRPELVVGLSPDADPATLIQHGRVTLGDGMTWMVDPEEAKAAGMLVDVALPQARQTVDRVMAFGVRASLDPDAAAAELSELMRAHRYATGAAFVPQGTPTNNTESDRAAWTSRPAPSPPPTRVTGSFDDNAGVLAGALGIDRALLAGLPDADGAEQQLAHAAQTALFSPTWGTFLDRVGGVSDPTRQAVRDLWERHVRGRGPLPALRIGDQPYGVLPAAGAILTADQGDRLEPALVPLLQRIREVWRFGLEHVPAIGTGPLDETLLEILGSAPQQLGLRVRSLLTRTSSRTASPLLGIDLSNERIQDLLTTIVWQSLGFAPGVGFTDQLGETTRPLGLPLVDDSDPGFIDALLREPPGPRSTRSVLQALLDLAFAAERRAIEAAAPRDESAAQLLGRSELLSRAEQARFGRLVQAALADDVEAQELVGAADRLHDRFGPAGPSLHAALQPVAAVRRSMFEIALSPTLVPRVAGPLALSVLGAWFRAQAQLAALRDAARALAAAPTAQRRIAVAETLDCASHRLDAWTTALPARRLAAQRAARPRGVMIGAYGWVEGLAPDVVTTRAGGYVHAPSVPHAATAGVLRSGYLTHNPDLAGSGALAVDLSSARVQRALHIVDGVRQGQPLGALLGYRLERLLHDDAVTPSVNRFVLSLRSLAPIVARRLTDRVDAAPEQAQESIAANNVVDGIRLLALRDGGFDIRTALAKPPDNLFLSTPWTAATDAEWSRIGAALRDIADAYDAAADVLLAEAVHQLAQGNTARAAAALDGASSGDALPVEPSVVATPTRGIAVGHRVLVVLPETAPGGGGWAAGTPRAEAEPRLAAWAEARLGPATDVVVHVAADGTRTTLDAAGLSAIDVVCDAADPAVLDRRLRAALAQLGDDPLPARRDPAWPAGLRAIGELAVVARSLARLLAAAQPARPPSYARPNDPPVRAEDAAGLTARVAAAFTLLEARTDALATLLAAEPVDAAAVAEAVGALADFGISLPASGELAVALAAHAAAARRVAAAREAATAPAIDGGGALAAGHALFGDGFPILAAVAPGPGPDLYGATFGAVDPGAAAIRRWLRDVATVRAGVARYAETLLFADATGAAPVLTVAQLAVSGTTGAATWLGQALPEGPSPDQPVTSIVVETPPGYAPADAVAALVVDDWADELPRRTEDGRPVITTGLAVNANGPNARAPQALLLAISPDGGRWTSQKLADLLSETLEQAKLRAITLERTVWAARVLPALQVQSWSLQGEPTPDIKFLATEAFLESAVARYVKEPGP